VTYVPPRPVVPSLNSIGTQQQHLLLYYYYYTIAAAATTTATGLFILANNYSMLVQVYLGPRKNRWGFLVQSTGKVL